MLNALAHVAELVRELMQPGELDRWHRVAPETEEKLMQPPVPPDSSCYPYYDHLDPQQLVTPDDLDPGGS